MDDTREEIGGEEITQVRGAPALSMLGNYRLGRPIAEGLLSVIYEGHNPIAQKRCAVKVFRGPVRTGPVVAGRYVHEAELVARIGHPSIGETYSSGVTDGQLFTAMEYIEGTDLRSLLAEQAPLSRRTYFPVLRGICAGLAAAHAYGISHRHLHPGQVMVQWKGHNLEVKVLDFGTHHLLPSVKDPIGWRPEHAIYLAPEQAKGGEGDSRSDIYALSVMLYEMVTGRVPFLAETFEATLEQHISEAPVAPSQVAVMPSELEQTILRGLEKDPRRRTPSVEALLAALDPMAVTGQHQLLGRPTTTGRHRALTALASQELAITPLPELEPDLEPQAVPPPFPRAASPLKVPRSRAWLFILLAVVALGCGVTIALLLVGETETPTQPKPVPRPRAPRPRAAAAGAPAKRATPRPPPPARPAAKAAPAPPTRRAPPAVQPAPGAIRPVTGRRLRTAIRKLGVQPAKGMGNLEIATPDAKAQVFVNGKFKGTGKLVILPQLPVGTYRIHLVVKGRKTPHRDVHLQANQRLTITF